MAETTKDSEVKHPSQSIPFLEVLCKSSGKIRRFSAGTESGFAVNLINEKLISSVGRRCLLANHIEAVKEGEEEPVSFGPTSLLVDYGSGWNLQTVIETNGDREQLRIGRERVPKVYAEVIDDSNPSEEGKSPVSYLYFAKILLAFLLIFVFGVVDGQQVNIPELPVVGPEGRNGTVGLDAALGGGVQFKFFGVLCMHSYFLSNFSVGNLHITHGVVDGQHLNIPELPVVGPEGRNGTVGLNAALGGRGVQFKFFGVLCMHSYFLRNFSVGNTS